MTTLFVGDAHVGNHVRLGGARVAGINERCAQHVAALEEAAALASGMGAAVVLAGDLLDKATSSPQVVAAAMGALRGAAHGSVVCLGNHDRVSSAEGDHGLAPLLYQEGVRIVASPTTVEMPDGLRVGVLPYSPTNRRGWLLEAVGELDGRVDALVAHCGVEHSRANQHLVGGADAAPVREIQKACSMVGAKGAFFGHHHVPWDVLTKGAPFVIQLGALVPLGWGEQGPRYGGVWSWDGVGAPERTEIPGPRFYRATYRRGALGKTLLSREGYPARVEVTCTVEEEAAATSEAEVAMERAKGDLTVLVLPETVSALETHKEAVAAVAAGGESGLQAYVDARPLPAGVSRAALHSAVAEYLGGAG